MAFKASLFDDEPDEAPARKPSLFDDDTAAPTVDMGPEARRARAGRPVAGGTATTEGDPGLDLRDQPRDTSFFGDTTPFAPGSHERAAALRNLKLPAGQREGVSPGWHGVPGDLDLAKTTRGPDADPIASMVATQLPAAGLGSLATSTTLRALGVPGATTGGRALVARTAGAAVEGGTASKMAGGDFATGAMLGAALPVAGGLARAARKILPTTESAIKNARAWVAKDIAGDIKGASTATARKQLADDAENASVLVLKDRPLDKAIEKARSGDLEALQGAQEVVQQRLKAIEGDRLAPHWDAATKALPGGGVRSGDVREFLVKRVDELRATGLTSDAAEADALASIAGRIEKAKNWGGGANGFNPNTIVPARQIQKLWADEAGNAYKSYGGINGTAAFERKLDIAQHMREYRDDMLAQAAKVDPRAAAEIRMANRDYSALKRIESVLDQRINNAKANAQGASFPTGLKRKVEEFKRSPVGFTVGLVPDAMMAGKRGIDKWLARRATTDVQRDALRRIFDDTGKPGARVRQAVAAGVPAALAMWAAQASDGGAVIQDGQTQ